MKLASKGSDRLPRKSLRLPRRLQLSVALALSATSLGADAAGLGRINVLSSLGQPLRAEIDVTAVAREEAASLTARLASADAFSQANIEYGAVMSGLRFSVQRRANGQPYVLVTSAQLLNEPFLDMLVELSWGSGRLVREYTVLIDPPELRADQRPVEPGPVLPALAATVVTRTPPSSRAPSPAPVASSSASSSAAVAPSPRRVPVATGGASAGDYVVQVGDTASSIARTNKPDGASLEQMLAALYRDNPKAFGGNIDRLLAGAALKLPDAAAAQSLDGAEARRVIASSSNFSSYRERIARNAAQAPTTRGAGQQASGRLSTQVDDSAAPAADAKDRLQLSRPDGSKASSTATGARAGVAGPSADDLAAKERELQETKTRLALLEKNVADLQQLLQLKNQTLADLQKGSAAAPAMTNAAPPVSTPLPTPAASVPVVATPAPAPVEAPAPSPVAAPTAATPPAVDSPPPVVKTTPAPAPIADESWFDNLKDNTLLLVGLIAIVLLLVGYGLFTARRRRKLARFEDSIFVDNSVLHANSVFGTTGGQSVDTANSGFHSNFVPVAGNLPEQNEVDPVAEADVYIAYGRDAQAEEILKEALRADPARHAVRLKLLEIYAKRGDAKTFETMASELYAATAGQGEDWKQAAALGATIDPHNPLYVEVRGSPSPLDPSTPLNYPAGSGRASSAIGEGLGAAAVGAAAGYAASGMNTHDSPSAGEQVAGTAPATATEYLRTEPMPRADAMAATSAPSMDLDFDLGFANAGAAVQPGASPAATSPATPAPADSSKSNGLDFDVGGNAKPLIDPFTASAFGAGDSSARTAVNLPAFRARAEQEQAPRSDPDGFSASDIFGSSIVADPETTYSETPPEVPRESTPVQARTQDFRNDVDSNQFEKTEPLDAFSSINLDLDNGGYESTDVKPDFGTRTDIWQAMATKLDLALAYSDIGDKDGARELLEEVVRNGDPTQADRARQLIGELG